MSEKPELFFLSPHSQMNQTKVVEEEEGDDLLNHDALNQLDSESQPLNLDHFPEFDLFVDDGDSGSGTSTEPQHIRDAVLVNNLKAQPVFYIDPAPHVSTQFYTFNRLSHDLMINCILAGRFATPEEIRAATPASVLEGWRLVWKDRSEDTAYVTAWKRIQEKLSVHVDANNGNNFLCFKSNLNQFVSHIDQWLEIVMAHHGGADLKHFGLKETIEGIKKMWTVGGKFYGIPESFIRVCVAECPMCSDSSSGSAPRSKRRKYEYTESFEVPAKEVPRRLQELATKHKVVLCIRQKYIRYKPFLAEVKDYTCHRAGEPLSTKMKNSKRESHTSKRCGCGFRIRAIVPILEYNDKNKTFVYQDEGVAVFKLYTVHSGHEPGPLDGNARILHRVIGHKGGVLMDQDVVYGTREEEDESSGNMGDACRNLQHSVSSQIKEVKTELGLLEGKVENMPLELLGSVSQGLFETLNKLHGLREHNSSSVGLLPVKQHSDNLFVGGTELANWGGHDQAIYGDGKDAELIEDDENSFGQTLGDVASWGQMRSDCRGMRDLLGETFKSQKWLKDNEFNKKSLLDCGDSKLIKPLRDDKTIEPDAGLDGLQVENFYPENPRWYDCTSGMDSNADCGDSGLPGRSL